MTWREITVVRTPVTSSCIVSVGYSAEHEVLDVEFLSGDVYRYLAVPCDAYERLLAAPSFGSHLNRSIKNRFDYVML